jgi:hypothetical protein
VSGEGAAGKQGQGREQDERAARGAAGLSVVCAGTGARLPAPILAYARPQAPSRCPPTSCCSVQYLRNGP